MNTKQILIAARSLIEKPENWTRYNLARNCAGTPTDPEGPDAVCFCAVGALRMASKSESDSEAGEEAYTKIDNNISIEISIAEFNDTHTHAEVLNVFDKAIADCSQSEDF